LESLPRDILEKNPWLLYWMGSCRLPFDPSSARSNYEKAFEKFRAEKNPAGIFLTWSGVVQSILSGFEDFKPLDQWISTLDELMHEFKTFPSEQIRAVIASNMFHALVRRQPHHPEIEDWAQETLASAEGHENALVKIQSLIPLALYRMYIGDTQETLLAIHQIRQLSESPDAPPLVLLSARFAEAMYYSIGAGSHEKCLKAVSDALELAQTTGIHRLDHMVLGQGVGSALNAGDHKAVEELLDKMAFSLRSFKPWEACFYHLLKTRASLLKGDPRQASLHAEMALKLSDDTGSPMSSVRCHLAKAHAMHELGKAEEAKKHLAHTFSIARQIHAKNSEFWALLAEALFSLDQGEKASTLASLQKALAIGKEEGYFITYIDRPSGMATLCIKALEARIEVEYVQRLIRKLNIVSDPSPFHLENWPWPLKIYTLGKFELLKDDKPIRFSGKAQQKPLSMLKALIAFGGREVREDQIGDALWSDADGDVAHHSFEMTLHRLRKLIDLPEALEFQDGRLTLDPRYCWVDVQAFEYLYEEVNGKRKEGLEEGSVQLTQRAIEMYRGSFLAGEVEQSWMVSARERLRRKFLKNLSWLGHYREQNDQWEKALECYEQGLEVDELAEELYRRLIMCYQRLGRKAEAISVYQRCKKTLSSALGIEPSSETKALHQKILTENR
jgi:DNA-binding SARP family transcriptional activator